MESVTEASAAVLSLARVTPGPAHLPLLSIHIVTPFVILVLNDCSTHFCCLECRHSSINDKQLHWVHSQQQPLWCNFPMQASSGCWLAA